MADKRKIKEIIKTSRKVFKECSHKNGAIVASNMHDPEYPKDAKNYYYVWPRDASFVSVACDLVGLKRIPENYFKWCWKAEEFKEKGIFYMRYYPNGKMFGRQFQPDQSGSLLWAIEHHCKSYGKYPKKIENLIIKTADGICSNWKKTCFRKISYDLWEERRAYPKNNEKHTYSVAICLRGLEAANRLIGKNEKWMECIEQMKDEIEKAYHNRVGFFTRTFGDNFVDLVIDSSILGLVWPSEIIKPKDKRIVRTVNEIRRINAINGGLMRYPGDRYNGTLRKTGAGAWPLLNFWMSIYYIKSGNKKEARKYYDWVIKRVDKKLPEQIKNNKPTSIIPLAWSHAMFIIASKFLGYI